MLFSSFVRRCGTFGTIVSDTQNQNKNKARENVRKTDDGDLFIF